MEDKVKIIMPKTQVKTIKWEDTEIKIINRIDLEKYNIIIEDIKTNVLFNEKIVNKYYFAKIRLNRVVLELCTNIDVDNMESEDLMSDEILYLLDNISNFAEVENCLDKLYYKYIIENAFGVLGDRMPSSQDIEKSMENIASTIQNLPEEKLELIAKSIAWNNAPALGHMAAPIEHSANKE